MKANLVKGVRELSGAGLAIGCCYLIASLPVVSLRSLAMIAGLSPSKAVLDILWGALFVFWMNDLGSYKLGMPSVYGFLSSLLKKAVQRRTNASTS